MKLIYFTAPWCVPCKTFGPIMDQVTGLPVVKVDIMQDGGLSDAADVMSVPTVILMDNQREVARFSGARTLDYVNKFIADHI